MGAHNNLNKDLCPDEALWRATNVDMSALERILCSHFRVGCEKYTPMSEGSYARAFLFSLDDGKQVVGWVVLLVRESIKTEAEVATMQLVRGKCF
jgi:hypothetical protein